MTIEVNNLSFQYEGLEYPILENIHFYVKKGEFVAVFGPNGGGKTTLLKLLIGFLKPRKGVIKILGRQPQHAYQYMSYVPQISTLDRQFPISVFDVVLMGVLSSSFWRSYQPHAKDRAIAALKQLDILDLKDRPFGSLSGGQTQRLLIARALVSNPSILLLDEPTSNVDETAKQAIYKILENLRGSLTIVMVSHDLQIMMKKVDHFLCVNREVTPYSQAEVCAHFAQGLYHPIQSNFDEHDTK